MTPGAYQITISGTSGTLTRATSATLVVQGPPDFALQVTPATQAVARGQAVGYQLAVTALNGFTGDVSVAVTGPPATVGSVTIAPPIISTSGTAQLTVSSLGDAPAGSYPLSITGTSAGITHSASATLIVTPPPDFTVSATPATRSAAAGAAAGYTITLTPTTGFTAPVNLALTGLPAAVGGATFTPTQVIGSGASQLTVTTAATAPPGNYPLTITGTSGTLTHTATATLTVTKPDFTIAATPTALSAQRGQTASYQATIAATGGFTGTVTVTTSGAPPGSTTSVSPKQVTVPGISTIRIVTNSSTKRGTFPVVVTATAATVAHQTTVTLTVR